MIQNKKRIISLILILTLLVSALVVGAVTANAAGENVSDFSTEDVGGNAYTTRTTAKGWVGVNCSKTTVDNETAFIMNGKTTAVGSITSPSLSGGVSSITFGYANTYSESNGVSVTITVTSSSGEQSTTLSKAKADVTQNTPYSHTWELETPITGDFTIKFTNNSPSKSTSNKDRVSIFNVTWVSYTGGGTTEPDTPACEHTNKVAIGEAKDATCTEAGITAGEKCSACGETITAQKEISALGHNYVNGACSVCGANEPNYVFKKVTATPADWSGTYLIVYEGESVAFNGALTTLDATSNHIGITINNGEIAFNEQLNESTFIIAKSDSGYTIKSASGYYIGQDSNKNGLLSNQTTTYSNTISLNSDGSIQIVGSGLAVLRYNATSGQYRFRYYTSSTYSNQKAIVLYKLVEKEAVVCTHEEAVYTSNNDGTHNVACECGYAENNIACSGGETSCVSGKLCEFCGFEYDTEKKNHNYLGGSCSVCTEEAPDFSGRYYIASIRSSGNYWYMTNSIDDKSDRYLIVDSNVTDLPSQISEHVLSQIFVLESYGNGKYYIYAEGITGDAKYLGWTSGNSGTLVEKESEDVVLLTVDYLESEVFNIHFAASDAERYLALNGTTGNDYFAFYKSGQKQDLSLIPVSDHVYAEATCTAPKTCACGATEGEALGHNHENCPHVACVGDGYYTDLQDAVNAAAVAGGDVHLIKDVVLTEKQITVTSGELVIYLDGHNITAEYSGDVVEVLLVSGTGVVNIEGDGKLYSKTPADRSNCVVSAIDGGQVYIYGGKYVSSGCAVIYATRGGHIKISGGYFEAEVPYDVDGRYYVLDFNEAETNGFGTIAVTGGTFVKFNPANHSNDGKDYTNKVVEGYVVKAVGDIYTVVELDDISGEAIVGDTYYETLQDAIAGATAGSVIVLNSDVTVEGDLTIENQVTINLNGKTLTAGAVVTFFEGTQFIGEGKLVVAKDSLYNIEGETKYVPVWNAPVLGENDEVVTPGYYTFSEVKDQIKESTVEDTEVVVFRPAFENKEIKKEFADGAADNGISFVINITWGTGDNAVSKQYTLTDEFIANVYNVEAPKAIQLGFENWQADVEYTVTLRIVSGGLYYETTLCTMLNGDVAPNVPTSVTE